MTKPLPLLLKIAAVLLLLYTLIAGLAVPLKPGILSVHPIQVESGTTIELDVVGYNSNYTKTPKSTLAFLKLDNSDAIPFSSFEALDDRRATIGFTIPYLDQPNQSATLIVQNDTDGFSVLPSALSITTEESLITANPQVIQIPNDELFRKKGFYFPYRNVLHETIRNQYFHVSLWMALFVLLTISVFYSIKYLRNPTDISDIISAGLTKVALLYGILGLATGSVWAKYTWGTFWTSDIKLNMTAIAMLIYFGYYFLRKSIDDDDKRARLSASYNIFAFAMLIPLVMIVPRLTSSLHPGNGGNPAFGGEDLDNTMRAVFYPSVLGFIFLGIWLANLYIRYKILDSKNYDI